VGILICSSKIPIRSNKEGAATVQSQISDNVAFQFIHNTVININSRIVETHYHPNPIQTCLPFDCEQYSTAITERKGSQPLSPSIAFAIQFFRSKIKFFLKNWKPWLEAHIETNNVKDLSLIGNFLPNATVNDDICSLRSPCQ